VTEVVTGTKGLSVVAYDTPGLGDRSYLVHDGSRALVVDPQRDPGPYVGTAAELGVEITLVLETHIHNDYVSGGLALARRTGAVYGISAAEPVDFEAERTAVADGDVLSAGALDVTVLATPGHTPHHLSFLVEDGSGNRVVLTGGSLLAGGTGRTDLLGVEQTPTLAEAQWRSVRRLLAQLDSGTIVLPTHGFGSFCSVGTEGSGGSEDVTIERERSRNPAAYLELDAFVRRLSTDLMPVPAYYRRMAPLNRAGAAEAGPAPVAVLAVAQLAQLLEEGAALVDVRGRRAFACAHWRGALNIELGPSLPVYGGWLVAFDAPLVIVTKTTQEVAEAQYQLARVGRERLAGWVPEDRITALGADHGGHYEVRDFRQLAGQSEVGPPPTVVDVRFAYEWGRGHIRGAHNVPLPEIGSASATLPQGGEIWVYCGAGYRAAIAASWLSAIGMRPVLVDDLFDNAAAAGLEIVRP
jgi:hydroxyacylglutathione hydrolase